ncbi:hypothetical protein D9M68_679510 [compost metagenome]
MQHLDRRLEHFDELEQALVRQAQPAGIAVGVRIVLRMTVELADVHLADQRGNVLVVFVARLGLGDGGLAQHGRIQAHDSELRDVAVIFLQALHCPRRHDAGQVAPRNAIFLFERVAEPFRMEQAQGRFIDRRPLQGIDGVSLHQGLEPFRDGRLAAAHGAQQIKDLLALFQALRGMLEERDDLPDHVLHAVELLERGIAPDGPVGKQTGKTWVVARIHDFRFAYRGQHALSGTGVRHGIAFGEVQIFLEGEF